MTTVNEDNMIKKEWFLQRDAFFLDVSWYLSFPFVLVSLRFSFMLSRGTNVAEQKPHTMCKRANPLSGPRHPNVVSSDCVIWVMTNMPIAGADATMPIATERHLTKYCRTIKEQELKIITWPKPERTPTVRYIIQSCDDREARKKPMIPANEPKIAVSL